jgi:hypothetical protein
MVLYRRNDAMFNGFSFDTSSLVLYALIQQHCGRIVAHSPAAVEPKGSRLTLGRLLKSSLRWLNRFRRSAPMHTTLPKAS